MATYVLDTDLVAMLIFKILPHKPPYRLALDRTNWKFGGVDINVFMVGVVDQGLTFPLLFSLLPKACNSNTKERIKLIDRFIGLFGRDPSIA